MGKQARLAIRLSEEELAFWQAYAAGRPLSDVVRDAMRQAMGVKPACPHYQVKPVEQAPAGADIPF